MEALRRSKASAGEAPNLPPQRGLSSLSLTMVQFTADGNGIEASAFGRQLSACSFWLRPAYPLLVLPYGGLDGGEAQRGVPGAVPDYVPADGVDELLVVFGED